MKLFITTTSPYARIVRMAIEELGLASRFELVVARTRTPQCEVNPHVPTGKVPMLQTDDGVCLSESRLIVQYLDAMHTGDPLVDIDPEDEDRAMEGAITGFLDGLAVWSRENRRPESERSPGILAQERARAERCLEWLEPRTAWLGERADYPRLAMAAALYMLDERIDERIDELDWRARARARRLVRALRRARELPAHGARQSGAGRLRGGQSRPGPREEQRLNSSA